jgi:hypothetical protein
MTNQVQKWLRQQSKDFYAAGFDALVKPWHKCINVGGGYVEKLVISKRGWGKWIWWRNKDGNCDRKSMLWCARYLYVLNCEIINN